MEQVQNTSEDPLTSAMILLPRAITQRFSNTTNILLRSSSNTRNQAIIQADRVQIQSRNSDNNGRNTRRSYVQEEVIKGTNVQNDAGNIQRTLRTTSSGTAANVQFYNCSEKGHYARNCPKPRVRDSKIQPTNFDSDKGPSHDSAFLSEVRTLSTSYVNPLFAKDTQEQKYLKQPKIINNKIGDDQIDSNIIFDEPNEDVNSGSVEYDNNVQESYESEKLARNAYKEAEKQQIIAKKVQQQNIVLTKQLESYKEKKTMELQKTHLTLKRKMSDNEDKYHDTVLDLEARAKNNEDIVLKMGNSLQEMFMLGPKPMSFYDSKVKHGLGYTNLYTLKKAISWNPKLYDASCLDDLKIQMNVRDTEGILDDATKSQIKTKKKSQDPTAIAKKQNI
ncbi:retrovirus-related pol polyprotein from transposon TNT 1-94 [Tanacetum coccineum]